MHSATRTFCGRLQKIRSDQFQISYTERLWSYLFKCTLQPLCSFTAGRGPPHTACGSSVLFDHTSPQVSEDCRRGGGIHKCGNTSAVVNFDALLSAHNVSPAATFSTCLRHTHAHTSTRTRTHTQQQPGITLLSFGDLTRSGAFRGSLVKGINCSLLTFASTLDLACNKQ